MIKSGKFGIYRGNEYRIISDESDQYYIATRDKNKIDNSFIDKYDSGLYRKSINLNSLDSYYEIEPKAIYHGIHFPVRTKILNHQVCLGTGDANLARKMKFERTDKYFYEKWVSEDEVQIVEEKKRLDA
ncbi:hypothetical protein [Listeria aquatica]|uniref:hypothetical protein n=1 Tax=Listeria aquatica TaxID=1494960 RepID=UPI0031F4BC66